MAVRLIARGKLWVFVSVLVCLAAILSLALPRGRSLTAVGDTTQCLLLAIAVFSLFANTKQAEQRAKYFWALLALGCGLWLLAQILGRTWK